MAVTVREYYSKRQKKKTFGYEIDITMQGQRIREVKRGFNTKTEAREDGKRRELEIKKQGKQGYDVNDIISKDKNKITVKELLELWIQTKKANVAPKTYSFYEFFIDMIIKDLGNIKAIKLKTEHIEVEVNKLLEEGLSSTTAGHYYTVLNIAYNWAIIRGYVIKNPCALMKKPKKAKNEMHVYNEGQLNKLLNRIKHMTCYIPVMLSSTTGMRLGEVCGLTWDCVNLENGFIEVKKQLQDDKGELQLTQLKTDGSSRKVILLDYTINALKELKEKQEENKSYLGDEYSKIDYVICKNNGEPYAPSYVSRNYRRVLKEYGICEELNIPYIRFHDLRHTHTTLLLKANVHPKIVSDRLGHANIKITLDTYSHILPDMQEEAVKKLNNMIHLD
ncbi:integrase [Clostridium tetanomorphum]|uniref:Site-specific integrase n=1 Tax=Clostridium tetanomorphum TaxID=1553 RepID=A0A923J1N4_CLOTT|nr:site-specific integrase [Clostridium tetanomorphum]KAJ50044.1 phage integrase [Clostridium tetanomorphum DSM 665]MBC2398979.1 site-specific integrase [Clostridium tetanomorphum]MBP1866185.1 integrase [Clostridium tetanomorphum]NRS86623.1 integrase [Clostridium tetanomorphum]NRZ95398.1 integrase [Clostridium tetanomorphum]